MQQINTELFSWILIIINANALSKVMRDIIAPKMLKQKRRQRQRKEGNERTKTNRTMRINLINILVVHSRALRTFFPFSFLSFVTFVTIKQPYYYSLCLSLWSCVRDSEHLAERNSCSLHFMHLYNWSSTHRVIPNVNLCIMWMRICLQTKYEMIKNSCSTRCCFFCSLILFDSLSLENANFCACFFFQFTIVLLHSQFEWEISSFVFALKLDEMDF